MKLITQFNILPRYLTSFNYEGRRMNDTPKNLKKSLLTKQEYWEGECLEHPNNPHCLVYDY